MNIIENLSTWARSITIAIIIVSILEMILPNNKTKKYVKMVMGVFILFNIISPFVDNKSFTNFDDINLETNSSSNNTLVVNQQSMDERLEELYIEEIEKDITKKVQKQGYKVKDCKVEAKISDNEEETGITKIILKVEKDEEFLQQDSQENNEPNNQENGVQSSKNNNVQENEEDSKIEEKLVSEIQKIKKVDTNISEKSEAKSNEKNNLTNVDIQNLKKFLIKEYEVNEKCLKIN